MKSDKCCEFAGCQAAAVVDCGFEHRQGDMPAGWYLSQYGLLDGLRILWRLVKVGLYIDVMGFCAEHAREEGFCVGCGRWWPPIWEHDRELAAAGYCLRCWGHLGPVERLAVRPPRRPDRPLDEVGLGGMVIPPWMDESGADREDLTVFEAFVETLDFSGFEETG